MRNVFTGLTLGLVLFSSLTWSKEVVIPGIQRVDYFTSILEKALSYHPEKHYRVKFVDYDVPKLRAFKLIANNEGIDTIAAGATNERQAMLLSVKLPLLKGLNGWRVPLVTEQNKNLFKINHSRADFEKLIAGQLLTWSDTKIIESNGIRVEKGSNYLGLFSMLEKNRFDYFPRSVLEIEDEFNRHKHMGIVIDPNIIIHYPTAYYFYVNRNNLELAQDIEYGLEQAIKDGSFDRLFDHYYGQVVNKIKRQNRRVFELKNPYLPKDVPLSRKSLWLTMKQN